MKAGEIIEKPGKARQAQKSKEKHHKQQEAETNKSKNKDQTNTPPKYSKVSMVSGKCKRNSRWAEKKLTTGINRVS